MNRTLLTLLGAFPLLLGSQLFGQAPPKYRLTFNDEFNSGFRNNKWASTDYHAIRNNSGDYQSQWFSDPDSAPSGFSAYNPFISSPDGTLSIQAMPTPNGTFSSELPYVSGMMSTAHKFTQRYGYYELRAKMPLGIGLWSRFWLLTDDGVWPGEYDVFEILGRDNRPAGHDFAPQVRQTTHYWDALSSHGIDGSSYLGINPLDGKFHTYGFLWKPDSVTWYVNGVPTVTQPNRINIPMYIILDLAVGNDNNWPGKVDTTTPFPANLEMDYFRVYSADPSLPSVTPEPGYTPSDYLPPEVVLESTPSPPQLPAGWTAGDVGTPDVTGSTTWNNISGEWMLKGGGDSITGAGQFARTTLPEDGMVTASVLNVTESAANDVRAGVTIRANGNPGSPEVSLYYKASLPWPSLNYTTSLTLQSRATNGGTMQETIPVPAIATTSNVAPVTLRLIREGNKITASYSIDAGAIWTIAGTPVTVSMSGPLLAGIAMGGNQNSQKKPARAIFDNVAVGNLTPTLTSPARSVVTGESLAFTASLLNPLKGSSSPPGQTTWSVVSGGGSISTEGVYTAPNLIGTGVATIKAEMGTHTVTRNIAITLPSPWFMPSLTRTPPGDAGVTSGVWTVIGGGTGISTTANQDLFRFIPSVVAGNETLVVRVDSSSADQAGLLFRDFTSISDNTAGRSARYAGIWRTPTGLQWATRERAGEAAVSWGQVNIAAGPVWLRIVRSGASADTFTASYSSDGNTWIQLGGPRTFTMTHSAFAGLAVASGSVSTTNTATFSELSVASRSSGSPTIASPATYPAKVRPGPSRVTGTTGTLAVLGADDGGEANLTYTWSAANPGSVTFSPNGTNSAKNSTATFTRSGIQLLTVTITDADGLSVISSVSVGVNQTFSSISLDQNTVALAPTGSRRFKATANDQFGLAMGDQPRSLDWVLKSGVGSIVKDDNVAGTALYTAPPTEGFATIEIHRKVDEDPGIKATASITVASWANSSPTIITAASTTSSPITRTTATLSTLAADNTGESTLTYTWSATGPAPVTYSTNGNNAAKNAVATFTQPGNYQFTIKITDEGGLSTNSSFDLEVVPSLVSITINSTANSVNTSGTQQFTASGIDQFGSAIAFSPDWSVISGEGSIDSAGLYTAPSSPGTGFAMIRVTAGAASARETIIITSPGSILPWSSASINTRLPGSMTNTGTDWTATGGGSNPDSNNPLGTGINGSRMSDSFHFISQSVSGDGELIVRLNDPGSAAQVGLMVRDTTDRSSRFASLIYTNQYRPIGLAWISRSEKSWTEMHTLHVAVSFPVWLKLVRVGNTFSTFRSSDRATWIQVGSTQTLALNPTVLAGLVTSSGSPSTTATVSFSNLTFTQENTPPSVATPVTATPAAVVGSTTDLSVLGADNTGESSLTYTWSATGPAAVAFSASGMNAAKRTKATFASAGTYTITARITDRGDLSTTRTVTVTVAPVHTSISIQPSTASVVSGGTHQFTATGFDQFGNALTTQPTFTWSVLSGGGSINSGSGLYTASTTAGNAALQATSGTTNGTATITVTNQAPTLATTATALPNPVTGTTTALSVIGADDGGEGTLTYTWSANDPTAATFSANGTNAAKNTTASFTRSGSHTLAVTLTDSGGLNTTSAVTVTVEPVQTSVSIEPSTASVVSGGTQQFTATGFDQFGNVLTTQPTFTWSVLSGGGSINSGSGLYTASTTAGNAALQATSGTTNGTATITVTNQAPTLATTATALPNPVTGTTTALSVIGADDGDEGTLTYTWSANDPTAATFSANGTNAAKNTTASFTRSGSHTLAVTLTDRGGLSTTSSVTVTVNQTLVSFEITLATATVNTGTTQQFTASGVDQFGMSMTASPTWSVASGGGTIDSAGLYTAPVVVGSGSAVVSASVGTISKTRTVAIASELLPSPWTATDISSTPTGRTSFSAGEWITTGGGSLPDAWGYTRTGISQGAQHDSFHFVSQPVLGDGTLVVKLIDTGNTAQAGLMIRESNHRSSRFTGLLYSTEFSSPGIAWMSRSAFNYTTIHNVRAAFTSPVWLRLVRSGNTFTASRRNDGETTWTTFQTQTLSLNTSTLMGFAVSSGSATSTATARFSDLSFTPTPNAAPTIATAATANPNPVTDTDAGLSVLGADDAGEQALTYTWSVASGPGGVTFSTNNSNAAKVSRANFATSGTYELLVTVSDSKGLSNISSVTVTVNKPIAFTPYESWISPDNKIPPSQKLYTHDPDNDSVSNLVEFALGGQPSNGADRGYYVQTLEDTDNDGQKELCLTVAVRNLGGSPNFNLTRNGEQTTTVDGIIYTIQGSTDLFATLSFVSEVTPAEGLPPLPLGYEYRTFRLDDSVGLTGKGFLRVRIQSTQ